MSDEVLRNAGGWLVSAPEKKPAPKSGSPVGFKPGWLFLDYLHSLTLELTLIGRLIRDTGGVTCRIDKAWRWSAAQWLDRREAKLTG